MKIYALTSIAVLTLILLAGPVPAQEIPALTADGLAAPGIPWCPFTDKPRVDHLVSKPDGGPAGLIGSGTYAFSAQTGVALEDMTGGTTILVNSGAGNNNSALMPIGFLFRYDGAFFTDFGINANGVVRLGGLVSGASNINSIGSTENSPKIMPYWDDLCVGTSGAVHYKKVGAGGSEKLVIEWRKVIIPQGNCFASGSATFQVWLFARTGVIQFVYGDGMAVSTATGGYSVGIQSGAATNFASVTTAGSSVSYTTANNTQTNAIAAGTSYLFTPNMPLAPSGGNAAGVTQSAVTVNWTDNAGDETAYLVRRTIDHINFYFVGNTLAPNSASFAETGLTPGTQYFYYVNALSDGAFSPDLVIPVTTNAPTSISSTSPGGPWSAPSTWAGGVVPDVNANVTIPGGSTVTIDTAAAAVNVTVGSAGGGSPAILKFGEAGAYSLTVTNDVTIGPDDSFTTGGGSANQHVLTVGGNLINDGTLDFSTNNNAAGAGIVFTGATDNTFGGAGPVTDIRTITVNKGPTNANILELSVANFTVQGSTTDGPNSAFLYLNEGTFKISGAFSGNHRTLGVAAYQVSPLAGLWINNPNYTVAAQNASVLVRGLLRVSAGNYNVGTAREDSLIFHPPTAVVIIEGGNVTTAGKFGVLNNVSPYTYTQTGGTVTTCTVGNIAPCFDLMNGGSPFASINLAGGDIVVQNPSGGTSTQNPDYRVDVPDFYLASVAGTTVHFGNAQTPAPAVFAASGLLPNVAIDTTTGGHTLKLNTPASASSRTMTRSINIGPGGVLDARPVSLLIFTGQTFVNNGTLLVTQIDVKGDGQNGVVFSGAGYIPGILQFLSFSCRVVTLALDGSIRTVHLDVDNTSVTNAAKLIIGNNVDSSARIVKANASSFDSPPTFELGPFGTLTLTYKGVTETGYEIPASRTIFWLGVEAASVTLRGGDLTAAFIVLTNGVVFTGDNAIVNTGNCTSANGYIDGTLTKRFSQGTTSGYTFFVGRNGRSQVAVGVVNSATTTDSLSVTAIDQTMPGMLPANSVSRYWKFVKNGSFSANFDMHYTDADARGNEANYDAWYSNGGTPVRFSQSIADPANNNVVANTNAETGFWTVGDMLDPGPVSVSGRVVTSGGNPIRNATVTISGGGLPAPVTVLTGSLGTYGFNNLQAGETYTVQVSAKRYRFTPASQQLTPFSNVGTLDFGANPQGEF